MVETTSAVNMASHIDRQRVRQFLSLLSLFVLAVAASIVILRAAPAPWFWLWLAWAVALFAGIFFARGSWPRAILFNLGIVAILLASTEGYFIIHEYTPPIYPDGHFFVPDDVLGWAPAKGVKAHALKYGAAGLLHGPKGLLFDRTYTIDSNGLRVAPSYRHDDLAGTILFFGCSFTFGEGLSDNETMPYQVGLQSGGRYRSFNFAFEAYGPNQMLAAIDHGNVRRIVDTTPQSAFYLALPSHVWRAAGRVAWGGHAPRYVLDADGTPRQEGFLGDRKPLDERLGIRRGVRQLRKSALWRRLSSGDYRINDDDIRLYFAVVQRSQELLVAQYPGLQFHVILWPNQDAPQQLYAYEKMREGFRRMGIRLHLVDDILPGFTRDRSPYILSSVDHHPNALADRLLAQYVLAQVERK
jgi:hypothetical protein